MAKMNKEQIKQATMQQVAHADGYDSDELSELREKALDYYYGRASVAPAMAGRASIQSNDVADMTEAVISQILPAFEADTVVEFEPDSPEDVEQARAETDAVNYVVMEMNRGYIEISEAIRDALLLRNGIMKVWVDERTETNTDTYEGLTDLERSQILGSVGGDPNFQVEVLSDEQRDDGLHDMRVRTTTTTRKLRCQSVDVTMCGWYADWDSIFLEDCPFFYEKSYPSRSDLLVQGFDKKLVKDLNSTSDEGDTAQAARNDDGTSPERLAPDPSMDTIEFYECYIRLDADGDGIAELLKVCIGDDTLLSVEPIEFIPYASGTPILQAHRFNGLGMYDKIKNIQDSKTHTLRQLLDNQNHANNSRIIAIEPLLPNMADVTNSRPAGVIRATGQGAIEPFPFNDIGPTCMSTLEYLDKVRSERGGASLDMQSAEMQLAGETAHGVERQMTSKEQLAAMMTRTLGETMIRSVFLLVHTAMRLYMPDAMYIRARGEFQQVQPGAWQPRERVNVKSGLSLAERMRKKVDLGVIVQSQTAEWQQGGAGITVTPAGMYNAKLDWCRAAGIDNPERYWQDPQSQEAQQAAQAQAQQAQQQQQMQMALLDMQRQIEESKAAIEQAKVLSDDQQHAAEMQFKYWNAQLDATIEEAKLVVDTATSIASAASAPESEETSTNVQ